MEQHYFYTPEIPAEIEPQQRFVMNAEESGHACRVLRMREGASLWLTDGKGMLFEGVLEKADPKGCSVIVTAINKGSRNRNYHLHIAVAPTKNIQRFEWFLEKATETGIDEITPLICHHSEKERLRYERLERIIIAAGKQARKTDYPVLHPAMEFGDLMRSPLPEMNYIAMMGAGHSFHDEGIFRRGGEYLVLIGPEGDFSPDEVLEARQNGFIPISLGESRLRTETAALAACMFIGFLNMK